MAQQGGEVGWADVVGSLRQQDGGTSSGETCCSLVVLRNVTSAGKPVVLRVEHSWELEVPMERKSESKVEVAQSCPTLCDPMDCVARQAPLSMEFSRQESWSGLPFPSPEEVLKSKLRQEKGGEDSQDGGKGGTYYPAIE